MNKKSKKKKFEFKVEPLHIIAKKEYTIPIEELRIARWAELTLNGKKVKKNAKRSN